MINLTTKELEHLEKLCNVHIEESQQENFLKKLDSIVNKLNELNLIDTSDINIQDNIQDNIQKSLRILWWISDFPNKKELLDNVKHEVINNSIVIKSALSNN